MSERLLNSIKTISKPSELTPSNQLRFAVIFNEELKIYVGQSHLFDIKDVVFLMTIIKYSKMDETTRLSIV